MFKNVEFVKLYATLKLYQLFFYIVNFHDELLRVKYSGRRKRQEKVSDV